MQIKFTVDFDAEAWKSADADARLKWVHQVEDAINEHAYVSNRLVISNADDEGHAPRLRDWWADGHYISAPNADLASNEAARLYGSHPQNVRPWTKDDQDALDAV